MLSLPPRNRPRGDSAVKHAFTIITNGEQCSPKCLFLSIGSGVCRLFGRPLDKPIGSEKREWRRCGLCFKLTEGAGDEEAPP